MKAARLTRREVVNCQQCPAVALVGGWARDAVELVKSI
jgi:hypothetical protein